MDLKASMIWRVFGWAPSRAVRLVLGPQVMRSLEGRRASLVCGGLALVLSLSAGAHERIEQGDQKDPSQLLTVNLEQAFAAAKEFNRSLLLQQEVVNQAQEVTHQSILALLPTISGLGKFRQQAEPNSTIGSQVSPSSQRTLQLTLTQPVFQGFADYAGIRQARLQLENQKMTKQQTELTVYGSVAASFFSILSAEQDLKNLQAEIASFDAQIADLKQRVRIGRSQLSDVLTAQSSTAALRASEEQIRGQIEAGRENFEALTGLAPESKLVDDSPMPLTPAPIETYLAQRGGRPDLAVNRILADLSYESIVMARASHLPQVNFVANYYLERSIPSLAGIHWDLSLTVTMPIFSWGSVMSKVRAATAAERQSLMALSQTEVQAAAQIKSTYRTLRADQAQYRAYGLQVQAAKKNYAELLREFCLGLVAHFNVLTALASFQDSVRAMSKIGWQVKLDWVNLESAVGRMPAVSSDATASAAYAREVTDGLRHREGLFW